MHRRYCLRLPILTPISAPFLLRNKRFCRLVRVRVRGNKEENQKGESRRNHQEPPFRMSVTNYSDNWRLLRITAWSNRFINNIRSKKKKTGQLTSEEINQARIQWIKHTQHEVIKTMDQKKNRKNLIDSLGLRLHDDGIWRCHGRYQNADMSEETKSPIFLPRQHYWTQLLVKEFHIPCHKFATSIGFRKEEQASNQFCINVEFAESIMVDLSKCQRCQHGQKKR